MKRVSAAWSTSAAVAQSSIKILRFEILSYWCCRRFCSREVEAVGIIAINEKREHQ
jgi:hypothetical protein